MKSIIYRILNLKNGKAYVGSSNRGDLRLEEHRAKLRCGKHVNRHLQSSWKVYGEDSFIFEVIENVEKEENLIIREQYWMDFYAEFGLYNIRKVADRNTGISHSEETKSKLREISLNHFNENGHKPVYDFWVDKYGEDVANIKMSEYKRRHSDRVSGDRNPMFGKVGTLNPNLKKIVQLDKDGLLIKEWEGIIVASRELSIYAQNISECCLGKRKTAGGFVWKFSTIG
jgi:group I intron endonuclease